MHMKTAVQFGAGNIGRGFMGQLFYEAGYRICFVDALDSLVESLKHAGAYPLRLLDAKTRKQLEMTIDRIDACAAGESERVAEQLAGCDVVGTAVGVKNLAGIAPLLARGIVRRRAESGKPLDIYLCENMLDAAEQLKHHVLAELSEEQSRWAEEHIGFVGTTVARMVPEARPELLKANPLLVIADSYHKLPYNGKASRAAPPPIEGLYPVANFRAEVEMKLFVYNLGHASLAYLGNLKGYNYVHETMEDRELREVFSGALEETCTALTKRYPEDITEADITRVRKDIDLRFGNPLIRDTIKRVGRDPLRKLGREDRLIGSALFCLSHGVEPRSIARVTGAALRYNQPEDAEAAKLQKRILDEGIAAVAREVTSLEPDSPLFRWILDAYESVKAYMQSTDSSGGERSVK